MIYREVLSYMAERSGIPLWIVDEQAEIRFSTIDESRFGDRKNMRKFFSSFVGGGTSPRVKKFDTHELYGSFPFEDEARGFTLVAGPAYEIHPYAGGRKGACRILFHADCIKEILLMMPTVSLSEFCRFVAVLAEIYTKSAYAPQVLEQGLEKYALRDWIDGRLAEIIFDIREEERETVYEPEAEKKFLSYVTKGNVEALQNFKLPKAKAEDAKETKYQNLFEAVALVTLATRAAISGGLDYVEAFSLSDLYFKRLSRVTNDKELSEIIPQILSHFAQRVKESSHRAPLEETSPYIRRSIQYIRLHLHSPIRLEDVAREVGLEPKYFSRLFVSLTGEKFSSFVQRERVLEAKNLLENTNRTTIDISNSLGFSSQSYFIKVFERYIGETPGEFLEKKKQQKGK